jgi:hypothetical protein
MIRFARTMTGYRVWARTGNTKLMIGQSMKRYENHYGSKRRQIVDFDAVWTRITESANGIELYLYYGNIRVSLRH